MKQVMDKLLNNIKFDKRYVMFCLILVIFGIATGAIFIVILNNTDKSLVIEYITSFIDSIKDNTINYLNTFKNVIIVNYIIIGLIMLIGFTYFLIPINIIILFYKSFIIGFSLGAFILTYKIKGLILSFIYIFPHLVVNILLFLLLTAFTMKLSFKMIKCIIKKKEVNIRQYFNKYISILLSFIIIITLSSLYESFVVPLVIKLVINLIL